jgi:glycosyltransferase involved in cell wall biosynthesis
VLDRRKGLEQILKLLQINKTYAFIVVGDGIERTNLQNLALKYKVQNRFLVLGPKKDGYRFMSYFDLFVIPSRSEGMPLALLEAMALKVPIVSSEIPEFTQEYPENTMSFFCLDNIRSLMNACEEGLRDRDSKVLNAYLNYQEKYTVKIMAEKYMKIYRSLMDKRVE